MPVCLHDGIIIFVFRPIASLPGQCGVEWTSRPRESCVLGGDRSLMEVQYEVYAYRVRASVVSSDEHRRGDWFFYIHSVVSIHGGGIIYRMFFLPPCSSFIQFSYSSASSLSVRLLLLAVLAS